MVVCLAIRASRWSRDCRGSTGSVAEQPVDRDSRVVFGQLRTWGYTSSVRAGASEYVGDAGPLRGVTKALATVRSPADLLGSKLLDQGHRAAAVRASPGAPGGWGRGCG